jgi:hypothetical protein
VVLDQGDTLGSIASSIDAGRVEVFGTADCEVRMEI